MTYSFDIFDTCFLRKCGKPENMLDILSFRVFRTEIPESVRQEFVAARYLAAIKCNSNSTATIYDIYEHLSWNHPALKSKQELIEEELTCEKMLLIPVPQIKEQIDCLREQGHHIIYISDMYLPESFIQDIMTQHLFLQAGDTLYVSCTVGKRKSDGTLYTYIKQQEHISFSTWHHFGDNEQSDFQIPKHLGIHSHLVRHKYTPYQEQWLKEDYTMRAKMGGILAGLGRALYCTLPENTHLAFMLDIVAPYYASLVYRLMSEAYKANIKRLYFCARDTHSLYLIAQQYESLFSGMTVKYLFISQKALYEGNDETRMAYYKQIGLASTQDNIGIVDVRSSGRTIVCLNEQLQAHNYCSVKAYYFEMFCNSDMQNLPTEYYTEVNKIYLSQNSLCQQLIKYWHLYEMFFSIHNQNRTIGYSKKGNAYEPIFDQNNQSDKEEKKRGNGYVQNSLYWEKVHQKILHDYVQSYIQMKLYLLSNECFERLAMPTLIKFMNFPNPLYLPALCDFIVFDYTNDCAYKPYVRKESLLELFRTRGRDTYWVLGSLILSLPKWVISAYQFKKSLIQH